MHKPRGAVAGFAFAIGITVGLSLAVPGMGLVSDRDDPVVALDVLDPCEADDTESTDATPEPTPTDQAEEAPECEPTETTELTDTVEPDTGGQHDSDEPEGEVEVAGWDNHGAAVRVAAHCDVPGRDHGWFARTVAHDHSLSPERVEEMCEELLDELENESTDEAVTHGPKAKTEKVKGGPPEGKGGPPPWAGGGKAKNH